MTVTPDQLREVTAHVERSLRDEGLGDMIVQRIMRRFLTGSADMLPRRYERVAPAPPAVTPGQPWHPEQGTEQPLLQYSADVMGENMGQHAGYVVMRISAGPRPGERVAPPAGEAHAFTSPRWARQVEVTVSPTGRSARVWVDGVEIPPPA